MMPSVFRWDGFFSNDKGPANRHQRPLTSSTRIFAWYAKISRRRNLNRLHNFLLFGWGRVAQYIDSCGEIADPNENAPLSALQRVHDVTFEQGEGLSWP